MTLSVNRYDGLWAITYTRNSAQGRELLRIVWEWNPHYRGRLFWRLWQFTPYIIVNEYHS
jgi:hypothetical protein